MTIIDLDGEYEIHGYVNSQNTFGAMLATDFTVRARNVVGIWEITNCRVGIKSAKNYAKIFTINYIILSLFVGIAGIIGYFILKKIVGF